MAFERSYFHTTVCWNNRAMEIFDHLLFFNQSQNSSVFSAGLLFWDWEVVEKFPSHWHSGRLLYETYMFWALDFHLSKTDFLWKCFVTSLIYKKNVEWDFIMDLQTLFLYKSFLYRCFKKADLLWEKFVLVIEKKLLKFEDEGREFAKGQEVKSF